MSWSTFKIGLFVLGGLALVLGGIASFGLLRQFQPKVQLETYVEQSVGGLAVGSPVKLKGVPVGEVDEIGFSWVEYPGGTPPAAVIRFSVDPKVLPPESRQGEQVKVPEGMRAKVETQGITGVATLALDVESGPGRPPPLAYSWKPRHPVVPSAPGQLAELLASAQAALGKLEKLDLERLQASVERAASSADQAFQRVGELDAGAIGREVQAAATDFRALAREARTTLKRARVEELAGGADQALSSLRDSAERLNQLLDRVATVDVQEVNATVASARQIARDLDQTLTQLRRYPSGFLFGDPPPRATAVEAPR